jgi:hypothetical protein
MKTTLISAASALLMFGTAFAREATVGQIVPRHGESTVVESLVVRLDSDGVRCAHRNITTTTAEGERSIRKSVDCEE